jgi:hypothetical protein
MIAKYAATMLAAALMAAMAGVWVSAVQPHRAKAEEQVALTCKVFLTQYPGNTKREAALPYLPLTDDGRRIHIARLDHSKSTWVTVKDGGPWNLRDNYWRGASLETVSATCRGACRRRKQPTRMATMAVRTSSAGWSPTPPEWT